MPVRTATIRISGPGRQPLSALKEVRNQSLQANARLLSRSVTIDAVRGRAGRIAMLADSQKLPILDFFQPGDDRTGRLGAHGKTLIGKALSAELLLKAVDVAFVFRDLLSGHCSVISSCGMLIASSDGTILTSTLPKIGRAETIGRTLSATTAPILDVRHDNVVLFVIVGIVMSIAASSIVKKPEARTNPSLSASGPRYISEQANLSIILRRLSGTNDFIQWLGGIAVNALHVALSEVNSTSQRCGRRRNERVAKAGLVLRINSRRKRNCAASVVEAAKLKTHVRVSPHFSRRFIGCATVFEGVEL